MLVVSVALTNLSRRNYVRATTAFHRILAMPDVVVEGVSFTPEGVVLRIRRRKKLHRCPCGWTARAHCDRSTRRWRHLDLGSEKCFLETEICRINCQRCGRVRTEDVPWARPGARHTSAFSSVVAWLAQRTDKTTITTLLRSPPEPKGRPSRRSWSTSSRRNST